MNKDLLEFIKSDTPELNPDLANGLAKKHMADPISYIDNVCRVLLKELGETMDFHFIGIETMTPMEEFIELTKGKSSGPRQYNLARTDTFMVRLKFRFQGIEMDKLLRLPIVGDAGCIHIFGTKYAITPVLSDQIISITPPKIFVGLMSVKLYFGKENHNFIADDVRQTYPVVKCMVYKSKVKRDKRFLPETPMALYLLCKHGMSGMFEKYLNTRVHYGTYRHEINHTNYPEKEYVIVRSTEVKPRGITVNEYIPTDIAFAIPRERYTVTMRSILAGIYYILDQFTVDISQEDFDNTLIWKVCLGKILFGHQVTVGKLSADVDDHLCSVDQYMDEIMKLKFKSIGLPIEDMYQLFFVMIDKFDDWLIEHTNHESNLYNKELSVNYYTLRDLVVQTVMLFYRLKKKNKNGNIKESDVREALRVTIRTDRITKLTGGDHGEVNPVSYSGDNMAIGITHDLIAQEKTKVNTNNNDAINLNDPGKRAHVSNLEVRTIDTMAKPSPDGSTRLNLCLQIDEYGRIVRDESLRELMDETQRMLSRD